MIKKSPLEGINPVLDIELAKIKASVFNAIISNGSVAQKENALEESKKVYEWCIEHIEGQAKAPETVAQ